LKKHFLLYLRDNLATCWLFIFDCEWVRRKEGEEIEPEKYYAWVFVIRMMFSDVRVFSWINFHSLGEFGRNVNCLSEYFLKIIHILWNLRGVKLYLIHFPVFRGISLRQDHFIQFKGRFLVVHPRRICYGIY